jgi:hypothetical protein
MKKLPTANKFIHAASGILRRPSSWIIASALTFGAALLVVIPNELAPKEVAVTPSIHCDAVQGDFHCWRKHVEVLTREFGPRAAIGALRAQYNAKNPVVYGQCHQLTHAVGNTVAEMYPDITDAFGLGDSFCWSGYYHGVVEIAAAKLGKEGFVAKANELCANIPGKNEYSFDYYNCVHGVGHALMAMTRNELFESLELCNSLSGSWEQRSCWGGVYMENVMADQREHKTKYLKTDDLMYPCTAVDGKYKEECYKMQTSYALTQTGYDFSKIFSLCNGVEEPFRNTCAESAGRDASGSTVSDVTRTTAICALAEDDTQQKHCIYGAVRDFISYHHSDTEAAKLCRAVPSRFFDACDSTRITYYSIF